MGRGMMVAGALMLGACSGSEEAAKVAEAAVPAGLYADAAGTSGICVGEDGAAAFILYADQGAANCAGEGRIEGAEDRLALVPQGDENCRLPLSFDGETLAFGEAPAACAYYCRGDATIDARALTAGGDTTVDPVDPAGEPLC
ncbi:hypothetical protein [Sphingomicrobium arenosum]|uniref:hypothetical protein n=1 Tax=Sphingomicrobium arenosum TaxID=2233861 RepID=UPI0022405736|nr:hypothetical protein [Sphingomicrobium arenosum]